MGFVLSANTPIDGKLRAEPWVVVFLHGGCNDPASPKSATVVLLRLVGVEIYPSHLALLLERVKLFKDLLLFVEKPSRVRLPRTIWKGQHTSSFRWIALIQGRKALTESQAALPVACVRRVHVAPSQHCNVVHSHLGICSLGGRAWNFQQEV